MKSQPLPWVLLIVADSPRLESPEVSCSTNQPAIVLAFSLTSIARTACLLEERLRAKWRNLVDQVWPSNVIATRPTERLVDDVVRRLQAINRQEPQATVIVIPYNHCAVEESTWLDSARGALRLAVANRNTVYCLHDNPVNDPRSAKSEPQICTTSVLVGSATALLGLCQGRRRTTVVDLVVEQPAEADSASFTDTTPDKDAPLNLVHIRLAAEYAQLQRQDVWHRKTKAIDVLA